MRVLKVIGAVIVCILAGLVVGMALGYGAGALGAPYGDIAAIVDAYPWYAAIIGAVWLWRSRKNGEQL